MARYADWYTKTLTTEAAAVQALTQNLDYEVLDRIVALLLEVKARKNRVIFTGCGTSGTAAQRIAHICSCIEVPAMYLSPAVAPHGALGFIQPSDIVVMIAKGGNTAEICNLLPCCKTKGATIIATTNNPNSILAQEADIVLHLQTGDEPDVWGLLPCASMLCVVAAWDAILQTVMRLNGFTQQEFLAIHPGGATGEALTALTKQ